MINSYTIWNCGKLLATVPGNGKVDAIRNVRQEYPILKNVSLMAKLVEKNDQK